MNRMRQFWRVKNFKKIELFSFSWKLLVPPKGDCAGKFAKFEICAVCGYSDLAWEAKMYGTSGFVTLKKFVFWLYLGSKLQTHNIGAGVSTAVFCAYAH